MAAAQITTSRERSPEEVVEELIGHVLALRALLDSTQSFDAEVRKGLIGLGIECQMVTNHLATHFFARGELSEVTYARVLRGARGAIRNPPILRPPRVNPNPLWLLWAAVALGILNLLMACPLPPLLGSP